MSVVVLLLLTIASLVVVGGCGGVEAFKLSGVCHVGADGGLKDRPRRRPLSPFSAPSSIRLTAHEAFPDVAAAIAFANVGDDDSRNDGDKRDIISHEESQRISKGGVVVIPNWVPSGLVRALREDARKLFDDGQFQPDGLTNTALREQGFNAKADRQTFRGGADWDDYDVGDGKARMEFALRMGRLREELAITLDRPTLSDEGRGEGWEDKDKSMRQRRHEITYNWYEPGAKLGRHLDEHHEETKGTKGWIRPSRRSVTWLVYLNENWEAEEGGVLRCFPRTEGCISTNDVPVGAHEGNLQVGWVTGGGDEGGIIQQYPVFLDCFRPSGGAALYRVVKSSSSSLNDDERQILSVRDFDVPPQPINFASFLVPEVRETFEQISTSRVDPRFVPPPLANDSVKAEEEDAAKISMKTDTVDRDGLSGEIIGGGTVLDVTPAAGTLVLFDSVTLPHLVMEVTGSRQRIAATGWFHEDSQFVLEV
ncbi:hypothetical protein ACHAXA_010122 [Cyclostephanos tholiformis]|uniref:Fe2OG dioxygenase domain-containing protein n=1 Tax=Cyclostephanos tholiformis TaxID=382380 RepID=A0ABD3RXP8_9STRA